jgi:homoserine O-acetyltransferase
MYHAPLVDKNIYTIPSFTVENGRVLQEVPVAYKTWGKLNETRDNVTVMSYSTHSLAVRT